MIRENMLNILKQAYTNYFYEPYLNIIINNLKTGEWPGRTISLISFLQYQDILKYFYPNNKVVNLLCNSTFELHVDGIFKYFILDRHTSKETLCSKPEYKKIYDKIVEDYLIVEKFIAFCDSKRTTKQAQKGVDFYTKYGWSFSNIGCYKDICDELENYPIEKINDNISLDIKDYARKAFCWNNTISRIEIFKYAGIDLSEDAKLNLASLIYGTPIDKYWKDYKKSYNHIIAFIWFEQFAAHLHQNKIFLKLMALFLENKATRENLTFIVTKEHKLLYNEMKLEMEELRENLKKHKDRALMDGYVCFA